MTGFLACWIVVGLLVPLHLSAASTNAGEDEKSLLFSPLISQQDLLEPQQRRNTKSRSLLLRRPYHRPLDSDNLDALYQGYGTHYVDLWVGCPIPQRQTVIVDTGSSITAFPCAECKECGADHHLDAFYDQSKSTCFQKMACGGGGPTACSFGQCIPKTGACHVELSYTEGSSWRAYEAVDRVFSGGRHNNNTVTTTTTNTNSAGTTTTTTPSSSFALHFACQESETGLFQSQLADGLLGMNMHPSSYWYQAYEQGRIFHPSFSLCFNRETSHSREGTLAGAMTLGGTDSRLHTFTKMIYAKQLNTQGMYALRLVSITLRTGQGLSVIPSSSSSSAHSAHDDEIKGKRPTIQALVYINHDTLNEGQVMVDSGTTMTYFHKKVKRPFSATWLRTTGHAWDGKSQIFKTLEELEALPTILFQFQASETQNEPITTTTTTTLGKDEVPEAFSVTRDIVVAFPPTHYMKQRVDHPNEYYPQISFTRQTGSVLGANFLMGHDVHFDQEDYRIGFAESDCDYSIVAAEEDEVGG
jgi:hypothetical protein